MKRREPDGDGGGAAARPLPQDLLREGDPLPPGGVGDPGAAGAGPAGHGGPHGDGTRLRSENNQLRQQLEALELRIQFKESLARSETRAENK